jgi:hypothetical protein
MPKPPDQHLSFEQYGEAAEALRVLAGILLFEFARHSETEAPRDQIARNFIARADTMVRGIFRLWEINDRAMRSLCLKKPHSKRMERRGHGISEGKEKHGQGAERPQGPRPV